MSQITARFIQGPAEVRRYLLDYTLDLNTGESLDSIAVTVSSPTDDPPTLTVDNIVLAPAVGGQVTQATFFVQGGVDGATYELDFLATTSLTQVIETVVAINVVSKT